MFMQAILKVILWDMLPLAVILVIGYFVEKQL